MEFCEEQRNIIHADDLMLPDSSQYVCDKFAEMQAGTSFWFNSSRGCLIITLLRCFPHAAKFQSPAGPGSQIQLLVKERFPETCLGKN